MIISIDESRNRRIDLFAEEQTRMLRTVFHSWSEAETQSSQRSGERVVTRRNILRRMLTVAATLPLSGIALKRASAAAINPAAGRGFYKIVTYEVPQEHWQEFLEMCRVNAAASLKEPGITNFEVLISRESPNTVIAVETYRDEDASKAHQQTTHFQTFVHGAQGFGVKRSVVTANRYYPV